MIKKESLLEGISLILNVVYLIIGLILFLELNEPFNFMFVFFMILIGTIIKIDKLLPKEEPKKFKLKDCIDYFKKEEKGIIKISEFIVIILIFNFILGYVGGGLLEYLNVPQEAHSQTTDKIIIPATTNEVIKLSTGQSKTIIPLWKQIKDFIISASKEELIYRIIPLNIVNFLLFNPYIIILTGIITTIWFSMIHGSIFNFLLQGLGGFLLFITFYKTGGVNKKIIKPSLIMILTHILMNLSYVGFDLILEIIMLTN